LLENCFVSHRWLATLRRRMIACVFVLNATSPLPPRFDLASANLP
jgi:hypothetical protein